MRKSVHNEIHYQRSMASTCRKDPRTAETMRKGCGNGAERLRKDRETVRGLSFKAETLRRCCGKVPVRYRPNAASGGWSYGRDTSH